MKPRILPNQTRSRRRPPGLNLAGGWPASAALLNPARTRRTAALLAALAVVAMGLGKVSAARKAEPALVLNKDGERIAAIYAEQIGTLRAELAQALPALAEQKKTALTVAREAAQAAQRKADAAQDTSSEARNIQAKIANWRRFWIGGAEKKIAKAQADFKGATTDADRTAAKQEVAKWQANKADGEKAIQEAQAALERAKVSAPELDRSNQAAQAALLQARTNELNAAKALLADVDPFLASDTLDVKLVKATVLTAATPNGLAAFAQQGPEQAALVEKLLADDRLMKEMLMAGGASHGKYGRAMEIYLAIQQASPKASEGVLHRLALATSLEHAVPIRQTNAKDQAKAPATVDPVKRYLHYEKAYLAGELDPAFKNFSAWEYRMVVDGDAPDEVLAWGRAMLRTYRPDHVYNPNYGWRYSAAVKTEVRYGSQNVKDDLPALNEYQNIPKDGGVCGRRAFFGRFILRAFGIPVWGVTQPKHAALSHWTPQGWVINLGAGFNHSWWDKGEVSVSGADFLQETQARAHAQDYRKVLRAQWISRVLGEPAYNDRKKVAGGIWSSLAHYQTRRLASAAVALDPLGEEQAEANEPEEKGAAEPAQVTEADRAVVIGRDGALTIPAVAFAKPNGKGVSMKSCAGGLQLHCTGDFQAAYGFVVPRAGAYALVACVATLQEGQQFLFTANGTPQPVEVAVPYTIGLWQQTPPVRISLVKGRNLLNFAVQEGGRGVTIRDFTLTPAN